ncbi:MAG: hypothetical protein SCH66_02720 [Methanolobus sp.]|nr:hypothetical protein [Methanolobus sp.]
MKKYFLLKTKLTDTDAIIPFTYYFLLALLVFHPLFSPGYILTLDLIWTSDTHSIFDYVLNYGIGGQLPFILIIQLIGSVVPAQIVQKTILFLILLISGFAMHRSVPVHSPHAKYFAGTLYMVNPFIYVRFLAGHFYLLAAYAFVPVAIQTYVAFLKDNARWKKNLVWTTFIGILDPHALLLVAVIQICILGFYLQEHKTESKTLIKHHVKLFLAYVMLNMFWILPLLVPVSSNSRILEQISYQDLSAFTGIGTISGNILISIAMMYGFWRGGYEYPFHMYPLWVFVIMFAIILFFSVYGFFSGRLSNDTFLKRGLALSAVISLVLGSGVTYPYFASAFQFLFDNFFFFKGMRDSQKFVGILILTYSFLGSMGIDEIIREIKDRKPKNTIVGNYKAISSVLLLVVLLVPATYSFTMFNGFHGQLKPTDYPEEWYAANSYLMNDSEDFDILFFPWHQYMTFSWTGRRIANPASIFFDRNTITGENMEVGGIYSHSTTPTQHYVQYLLEHKHNITNFGELVTPLNVKYVVLAKEVDFREYDFLYDQEDMTLVMENDIIAIFRNKNDVSRIRTVNNLKVVSGWDDIIRLSRESDINNYGFIMESAALNNENTVPEPHEKINYTSFTPFDYNFETDSNYIVYTPLNHEVSGWTMSNSDTIETPGLTVLFEREEDVSTGSIYYWPVLLHLGGILISLQTLLVLLKDTFKQN